MSRQSDTDLPARLERFAGHYEATNWPDIAALLREAAGVLVELRTQLDTATEFTICDDRDDFDSYCGAVQIAWRGPGDRWAVARRCFVLNRDGEWEYEPIPSSRDDAFKARTRFGHEEAWGAVRVWHEQEST